MRTMVVLLTLSALLAGCGPAGAPAVPSTVPTAQANTRPAVAMTKVQPTMTAVGSPSATLYPKTTALTPGETSPATPSPVGVAAGNAVPARELARWGTGQNWAVTWSPDGQWLAIGTRSGVYLYDAQTMAQARYIETQAKVFDARFSPDSAVLAAGLEDGRVQLWQVSTGEQVWSLGHDLPVYSVAFSPDGQLLAIGLCAEWHVEWDCTGSEVQLLETGTSQVRMLLPGSPWREVDSLAFSPDGRFLATAGGMVWEVATGQQVQDLGSDGRAVVFSPDGAFLAVGYSDPVVRVWEVATWNPVRALEMGEGPVYALDFSPDGTLLAGGNWGSDQVRLWNLATGKMTWESSLHDVIAVAFSPRGDLLAAVSAYEPVRLWDVRTGQEAIAPAGSWGMVARVAFFPNGTDLAVGNSQGGIWLGDLSTGQFECLVKEQTEQLYDLALSPDGGLLAFGLSDNTVRLWDVAAGQEIGVLPGVGRGLAFSPAGAILAVNDTSGVIQFWDIEAEQWTSAAPQWSDPGIVALSFSPAGDLFAAGTADGFVRLWSMATGEAISLAGKHRDIVWSVAFSPDGRYLASGGDDETVRLWDVSTGEARVFRAEDRVRSVAFSPDSTLLAGGTWSGPIRLWEVATGAEVQVLQGHSWAVESLDFSPDGRLLLSGSHDGTVRLWGLAGR